MNTRRINNMNSVALVGRLTRENELRYSTGDNATAILKNSIAVQRKFKNAEGNYDADFINITAFGKSAEFIANYFTKGSMIGINGRIQTGSYVNKDGVKVYTTDVIVENAEFVSGKKDSEGESDSTSSAPKNEPVEEDLPF
jgi:single-strand DNA-binding protein